MAFATPGGVVAEETCEFYADYILDGVRAHLDQLNGVMLSVHGAMVVEHHTDGEGDLIRRIRDPVDDDVPIVVTLDLTRNRGDVRPHANVSERMATHADALIAYET